MNLRKVVFVLILASVFNFIYSERIFEYNLNIIRLKEGYSVVENYYINSMKYAELSRLMNIVPDSIRIDGIRSDYDKLIEKPEKVVKNKEIEVFYSTKDAHSLKNRTNYLKKIKNDSKEQNFNKSMLKLSYLTLTMTAFLSYYSTEDITWFEDNTFYFFFAIIGFELVTFIFNTLFL